MSYGLTQAGRLIFACLLLQSLTACTLPTGGAKPTMPIEQGMTFYLRGHDVAPTVLMLPGCGGGQTPESAAVLKRKAEWLNDLGYHAVVFDFTKLMGVPNACMRQITVDTLRNSALDAFAYIAKQPYVERDRVVLLGWSMGASLALAVTQVAAPEEQASIAGVAAYYPGCVEGIELTRRPTLLLIGLADTVVNPYDCLALINRSPQATVDFKTYWGAHHGFDLIENDPPKSMRFFWKKLTAAYDAPAAAHAENALREFLLKNAAP